MSRTVRRVTLSRKKGASLRCVMQSNLCCKMDLSTSPVRAALHLTLLAASVVFIACAPLPSTPRKPSPADSVLALTRLDEVLVEYTRHVVLRNDRLRLALGLKLDRLPTHFVDEQRESSRAARATQRSLENIWYEALRQDDYITLIALHWELENEVEAAVYRSIDFSGLIPGSSPLPAIARALEQHPIEDASDVARYLFLIENLSQYFAEARQLLADRAKNAMRIPAMALDSVASFFERFRQPGERSPFALSEARLTRIDSVSRPKVAALIRTAIERDVNPKIDSLVAYLRGPYRVPREDSLAGAQIGLGRYPGGREYYQHLLRRTTTLDVTPNDLFTYGTREVERILGAMAGVRGTLGFSGTDSAFRAALRNERFRITSPNDFEERVRAALGAMRDTIRSRVGLTLLDSLVLVARRSQVFDGAHVVALLEGDGLDPRHRLEYASDRITQLPAYVIPALVAREIIPGRQVLVSAMQRNDSLATIRQLMRFPGMVDGWNEHARGLAGELGLYRDPYVAYGALMLELEAAARMVTDLGLHHFGWTYQQAVRYLRSHSVDTSGTGGDVMRIALAEPARAVAAKVGSRELAGQRAYVKRELGARFDDGALQREILRVGVLPLPVMSQHLAWWVYQRKK